MHIDSIYHTIKGYAQYKRLRETPIIIGGCERSGTTLLLSILSSIRNVFAIKQETWALCYSYAAGFNNKNPINIKRLFKYLGSEKIPKHCSRWCEKSPANVFYTNEIINFFSGNVKIIIIVRDGRDVVTSIHPSNTKKNWVSIKRWISSIEAGLSYSHLPQVMTIRYEDLIINFELTIKNLCHHIEEICDYRILNWHQNAKIKNSKNIIGKNIDSIFSDSIGKYKNHNFKHPKIIEEFMNNKRATELLKIYNYAL